MSQSMYAKVLGADFDLLHPQIQRRFGFTSADGIASIGNGIMSRVWHGKPYTLPFLYVGAWRRIMFPEQLKDVPFTIENYAYVDELGRETMTWIRTFRGPKVRRFDAYMIHSVERGCIVDYLGTHQHLAVDIEMSVSEQGGLRLRSGSQRFYERFLGFRFPMFFSGIADVHEWYDDASGQFQIQVDVRNSIWGPLFGYRGYFDVEWRPVAAGEVPECVLPKRTERRE
ncbi:hypothetical protein Poly30_33680 [Planctomycetes bacterium Poly30]|uniref:DUF4166 domain-containing protein n=1 Tax=Saltatorellus ferox TaxID=2528018 RepID=A0A518EUQ4_9BACT|nr:hypothetical protein Poly30_33680 [Planctomycetes bacterium Poly30]